MEKYERIKGPAGIGQNPVMIGRVDPMPLPPVSPIQQEWEELKEVVERLEKEQFLLRDALIPVSAQPENKTADGPSADPSSGCPFKDHLAELKNRLNYIKRITQETRARLWL